MIMRQYNISLVGIGLRMNRNNRNFICVMVLSFLFSGFIMSCKGTGQDKQVGHVTSVAEDTLMDVVTTMKVEPSVFNMEIISNGKVEAKNILSLSFEQSGLVKRVYVSEGTNVSKGQIIAELDRTELHSSIEKMKMECEASELMLKDLLIGQGYSYDKKNEVPENLLRTAMLKSGYLRNKKELEDCRRQAEKTLLRAPFAGVIANLKVRQGSMAGPEPVCDLIGRNDMEVCFPVLQNEVGMIKKGESIIVRTFDDSGKALTGRVVSINPIVDDRGQIKVKASIQADADLITGMNVRVLINKAVGNQLVVPKTAVAERSGRKVIFSVENGKACWHYVNLGLQNTRQYTVVDGLQAGMEIITSGVQNLSDGSSVKVQN